MLSKVEGKITKVMGLYYTVSSEEGVYNCVLRGKIRKNKDWKKYTNPAAVGDNVLFEINDDKTGVISEIINRKNLFSRKDKGRNRKEDIIAANIDLIVIMQSFVDPMINLRFVDRVAVRGIYSEIPILLCVNKIDLANQDVIDYVNDYYENTGIDIIFVSALEKSNLEELKSKITGKRSIFAGFSGVGKSTILNSIYSGLNLRTSDVSISTGKGRHTTTNVELIAMDLNTELVDTPGVREFGLMDIEPHMLGKYFYEFNQYSHNCTFSPCTHDHEPGCEIKRMVEDGEIYEGRYTSYINILYSIKEYYEQMYK